jgi:hypothetical protein
MYMPQLPSKKRVHYIMTINDYATIFSANNCTYCVYYMVLKAYINAHSNFAVIQNTKCNTLFLTPSTGTVLPPER